jgi:ribosome-binding factor A
MATTRQRRVSELLKVEVSHILQREVTDPRVGFVTVTEVTVTPDLREARVFVSVMGERERREEALKGLQHAAGFVRTQLARRIDLRVTPEVTFALDDSLERGTRVVSLLEQLDAQRKKDE